MVDDSRDGVVILLYLAAAAAQPETARTFIQGIYAGYAHQNYDPLHRPERIFAPKLTAAIREDERLANGEVGYLDGDPLCACQDYSKLGATIRTLKLNGSNAVAAVHITFGTGEARNLKLTLLRTTSGWRIADVAPSEEPSLLRALEKSNAEAKRHQ
jgi:hypothetical protein